MRLPSRKITLTIVILLLLCAGMVFIWSHREHERKFDGPGEKLTLGIYRYTVSALMLIAQDQGFFARKGLDVTNKHYEYGVLSIKDVLEDRIDIAAATDSVVAWNILQGKDLKILTSVDAGDLIRLVARNDRGIRQWSDLKGKKVGLTVGTVTEFFLDRALTFNQLSRDDIEIVNLSPLNTVDSFREGSVDAIVVWSPLDELAEKELGGKVVSWSVQYGQDYYWLLICKSELIRNRPQAIERLFAALALSENFIASNRVEAQRIVERLQANPQPLSVDKAWPNHNLKVSLDQQLVVAMEDAARWFVSRGYSKGKTPNFLNFIYFEGLEAVKPGAVSIIH